MTVTVSRNGVSRIAKARATVVPCTTGDSILDTPDIRSAFMDLLQRSGPDLQPGDGIANGDSVGNKREHAGWVFKTSDGDYYFVEDVAIQSNAGANECYAHETPNVQSLKRNPTDVIAAHVHTHPTHKFKKVYGCPPVEDSLGNKVLAQRGRWDTGRKSITKVPDIDMGGGSWADWGLVVTENRDEFVINADGEVWRLPTYLWFQDQSSNRLFWKYSGNSNSSCNW